MMGLDAKWNESIKENVDCKMSLKFQTSGVRSRELQVEEVLEEADDLDFGH